MHCNWNVVNVRKLYHVVEAGVDTARLNEVLYLFLAYGVSLTLFLLYVLVGLCLKSALSAKRKKLIGESKTLSHI